MAFYYDSEREAEAFLRSLGRKPVLYAKVFLRVHGTTKWIVDEQQRNLGSNIQVLEDLTSKVDQIQTVTEVAPNPKNLEAQHMDAKLIVVLGKPEGMVIPIARPGISYRSR